jgi:hypothetical protein
VKNKSFQAFLGAQFREEAFGDKCPVLVTAIHANVNKSRRENSRRPRWFLKGFLLKSAKS